MNKYLPQKNSDPPHTTKVGHAEGARVSAVLVCLANHVYFFIALSRGFFLFSFSIHNYLAGKLLCLWSAFGVLSLGF